MLDEILPQNCSTSLPLHTVYILVRNSVYEALLYLSNPGVIDKLAVTKLNCISVRVCASEDCCI